MDGFSLVDIYSTKGIEYMVAVVFFFGFLALQWYMLRPEPGKKESVPANQGIFSSRFLVPSGYSFHPGHTWMKAEPMVAGLQKLVRVGMDDFAQKLIGKAESVQLPPIGARLAQGDKGWSILVDSTHIPMLSPVAGEVVEVNPNVLRSPDLLNRDPYGDGWLIKVKSDRIPADARNLLSGNLAMAWMEKTLENLNPVPLPELGVVMQDGGLPLDGLAKILGGENWQKLAKTYLLTEEV